MRAQGSVVDVGGGGEGVIVKACGHDIVSLDIVKVAGTKSNKDWFEISLKPMYLKKEH